MPESLLTFIVPVYKPDAVLFDKVLRALCAQSLKSWDAVFVLDGPCDYGRAAISRAFKKVPNSYKILELEHGGVQKARNAGFRESKGNYVVFWDSDCIIEPHAAKAWVDILDRDKKFGFVYAGYKFLNEQGAINSEPFDPFMLRVRNFISSCFPVRRELVCKWNEDLKSLQDWDFWLSVVEKGGVGKYMHGYAFSTAYPTQESISGKGCSADVWLERMDAVRALHGIPINKVCVSSIHNKLDGIALAKAIGADYQDYPNDKPNHYKHIIQIGFSLRPGEFERCAEAWGKQHSKYIFWTAEDVETVYDSVSLRAIEKYATSINPIARQFVEDNRAKEIMNKAGFLVEVLPLPTISNENTAPLPENPKFLVDVTPDYGHVFNALQKSIPDIGLELISGVQNIEEYTGLVCFHKDGLLRPSVKRMIAAGRHVISNIQAPFTGYMSDHVPDAKFIKDFVDKIREASRNSQMVEAVRYYIDKRRIDRIIEAVS